MKTMATMRRLQTSRSTYQARRSSRRGQALVEFALVGSILIMLALGLIQYAWIYNAASTLTNIARDGARYAAKHGTENQTNFNGSLISSDAAIRSYIRQVATGTTIDPAHLPDSAITISPVLGNSQRASGRPITITIRYDLSRKFIVSRNFPGLSRLGSSYATTVTMIIE